MKCLSVAQLWWPTKCRLVVYPEHRSSIHPTCRRPRWQLNDISLVVIVEQLKDTLLVVIVEQLKDSSLVVIVEQLKDASLVVTVELLHPPSLVPTCPTSAMTERVKGMPTMAKRMQKTRPAVVTGAMLPYPVGQQKKNPQSISQIYLNNKLNLGKSHPFRHIIEQNNFWASFLNWIASPMTITMSLPIFVVRPRRSPSPDSNQVNGRRRGRTLLL